MKSNLPIIVAILAITFRNTIALSQDGGTLKDQIKVTSVTNYNEIDWEHIPNSDLAPTLNAATPEQLTGLTNPTAWHFIIQRLDWSQLSSNAVQTCSYLAYRNADEKDIVNAPNVVQQIISITLLRPILYLENDEMKRLVFLKHCALQLHSAIDTNRVELSCNQLTNKVKAVAIKQAVSNAMDFIDKIGLALDDKNVKLSSWNGMYSAHIEVSSVEILVTFYIKEMFVASIQGSKNKSQAFFYKNGKLKRFSNGVWHLNFNEDGSLDLSRTYGFGK